MVRPRSLRRALHTATGPRDRRLARRRPAASAETGVLFRPSRRVLTHAPDQQLSEPNLLDLDACLTVDAAETVGALDFAFAGGSCGELLRELIANSRLPASNFDPDSFARDLFLEDLVRDSMAPRGDGSRPDLHQAFIVRVLAAPPADFDIICHRRAILAELDANPALHDELLRLYRSLSTLWQLLSEPASSSRYEATHRRIDVLSLLRSATDHARAAFEGATSGLSRVADFARDLSETDAFARLVEVLDYEDDLAKIDVRLQVGVDGRVRRFHILNARESDENRFYQTPLGRWVARVSMWWRGYKFSGEELVDRWLDRVFEDLSPHLPSLVMLSSHIEVYLAVLALRDTCRAKGLAMALPELLREPSGEVRVIDGLFNPLLLAQGVVPKACQLTLRGAAEITIVTGPNSGGKTRLLQALGLAQLLGQGGFFAPMAAGTLALATGMFVSVIGEHSAVDKEGRLGSELIRIRRLFERARGGALVILDELCSGTNPSEGEEIFYLVLRLLGELGANAFITTHFLSFARRLHAGDAPTDEGLVGELEAGEVVAPSFLQVELDGSQRPTYGFVPGVATTSLATQTAARLGVTREELMTLVRRNRDTFATIDRSGKG